MEEDSIGTSSTVTPLLSQLKGCLRKRGNLFSTSSRLRPVMFVSKQHCKTSISPGVTKNCWISCRADRHRRCKMACLVSSAETETRVRNYLAARGYKLSPRTKINGATGPDIIAKYGE